LFRRKSAEGRQRGQLRLRWLPGVFALLFVLASAAAGWLQPAERLIYDATLHAFAPPASSGKVAVVELSPGWKPTGLDETLRRLGSARAVAFLPNLEHIDNNDALAVIKRHLDALNFDRKKRHLEPYPTLLQLQRELDISSHLIDRFTRYNNVILAAAYRGDGRRFGAMQSTEFGLIEAGGVPLLDRLPTTIAPALQQAAAVNWPVETLRETAAGVGLFNRAHRGGGYPALVEYKGQAHAGLLLQLLRLNHGAMEGDRVSFEPGGGIRMGPVRVPTDNAYRFFPFADLENDRLAGIHRYDYSRVAAGTYAIKTFRGMTVFIGEHSQVAPLAMAMDALLQQEVVKIPGWAMWGQYATLIAVTLMLTLLLPRMRFSTASVTTVLVLLLLMNGEFLLLLMGKLWLPLMLPVLVLLIGYPLIVYRAHLARRDELAALELSDANRQLGRMLQVQGELDQALEKYRRCRVDEALLEQLYHLGLDFERKRQFAKAVSTFRTIQAHEVAFRDVADRIKRNEAMEQRVVLAKSGSSSPGGTVIMDAEGLQKPTLGHYEVERELGRGAMGMVYLGKDPRIGRMVAIKTMALSDEFEGAQLEEVRQRFYREAETAGRLNHPNIVHVYDIGEEQELAYIAMDYLQGEHLGHFVQQDKLLPIDEVLAIVQQVAEALDYAHKQSVVHRDIKPANIIYDAESRSAKVTDFGVACLTDASKTKTGTVLGSPSYMSPEQVAGKKVDGRADIFSLGVTLYQLVTGHLPFEADSLGSLMYKIANEDHPKPSKFRKGLPACVTRIINKCMQKTPDNRYQSGKDLAAALERCRS